MEHQHHRRFLVITFLKYYPDGGINDVIESFDNIEQCNEFLKEDKDQEMGNYVQIYDRIEGTLVLDKQITA